MFGQAVKLHDGVRRTARIGWAWTAGVFCVASTLISVASNVSAGGVAMPPAEPPWCDLSANSFLGLKSAGATNRSGRLSILEMNGSVSAKPLPTNGASLLTAGETSSDADSRPNHPRKKLRSNVPVETNDLVVFDSGASQSGDLCQAWRKSNSVWKFDRDAWARPHEARRALTYPVCGPVNLTLQWPADKSHFVGVFLTSVATNSGVVYGGRIGFARHEGAGYGGPFVIQGIISF